MANAQCTTTLVIAIIMPKFRQEKSLFFTFSTVKNFMACKFRKLCKKLVDINLGWELGRFTQFFTPWKKRDLLSLGGKMKGAKTGEALDEDTTSLQIVVVPSLERSNLSFPISYHGNRAEHFIDNAENLECLNPEDSHQCIEEITAELEYRETIFKLSNKSRKYRKFDSNELWATKVFAYPVSWLFPKERREEWRGDLHEIMEEMIRKGYGRRQINSLVIMKTIVLMVSALKIKLSDFISIGKPKDK